MTRPAVLQRQGGRRIKKVPKGERTQIGVIVGGKTKALLLKAMQESGRTISREAEYQIVKALADADWLAGQRRTLEEMERGNVEMALRRKGYTPIYSVKDGRGWKLWAEPGFPGIQRSGFEAWRPGELEAAYPDHKDAPSEVTETALPPPPPGIDLDQLYLEWVKGEGWKWRVGKAGWSNPSKGETP